MATKKKPINTSHLLKLAKEVLTIEAEGISGLIAKLDQQFHPGGANNF